MGAAFYAARPAAGRRGLRPDPFGRGGGWLRLRSVVKLVEPDHGPGAASGPAPAAARTPGGAGVSGSRGSGGPCAQVEDGRPGSQPVGTIRLAPARGAPRRCAPAWLGWTLAPLGLIGVLLGLAIVRSAPFELFGFAFGGLVLAGLGWILVSALHPARADRTCPSCAAEALERSDPDATRGVRCATCGFEDDAASSFLLAEDEGGSLEPLVLRGRSAARETDSSAP